MTKMTSVKTFNQLVNDYGVGSLKVKTFYSSICKTQDLEIIKQCTQTLEDLYMGKYSVDGEIAYELVKTYKK